MTADTFQPNEPDELVRSYAELLAGHPPYIGLTFALACRSGDRAGLRHTRHLCLEALVLVEDRAVASTVRGAISRAMRWSDDGRRARCVEKACLDLLPIAERAAYYGRVHDVQEAMAAGMSGTEAAASIA